MKNLFNILGFFLLSITIISCGGGEKNNSTTDVNELINVEEDSQNKNQIIKILKETPLFYARCEEFECNIDNKLGAFTIMKIVLSSKMSVDKSRQRICDEILKSISGGKIVFNSKEESQSAEGITEEYRLKQKGDIILGENKFNADLYFNGEANENIQFFHGKIIFSMPSIKSLNGEKVIIEVKGRN